MKYEVRINPEVLPESTAPDRVLRYIDIGNVDSFGRVLGVEEMRFEDAPSRARRIPRLGDSIIATVRTYLRAIAYISEDDPSMVCSTGFAVVRPGKRLDSKYLFYWLRSDPVVDEICARSVGVSYPAFNGPELGALPVPLVPLDQQRRIADFLDRKTASIDALIAKQEQLLALLAEKRQALITQAVTKGLDPNVPMKDSGVEWIGAIPAVWRVARIRHVAKLESGHTPSRQHPEWWIPDECTIPWVSLADVWKLRDGVTEYISDTTEKISEAGLANSSARLLPAKTVILSRTASVGFSAIISVPMATTQDFVNWICGPSVLPEYLLYVLRAMKPEFARLTQGSVHRTIYMPDVARLVMPVPSLGEQQRIVTHVRSELRRLDAISQRVQAMIEKLREYRQALITAAVTGQLDVTSGAAATSAPKPYAEAVGT